MTAITPVGIVVLLGVIMMPVYITLVAWVFAEPRDMRTAGVGIGYMAAIAVLMVLSTAALAVGFLVIDWITV